MNNFTVYSDYSMNHTNAAYAYVIIQHEIGSPPKFYKCGSRILKVRHESYVGEVMGMLAGIRFLPDNSTATANIDVDHITILLKKDKRLLKRQYREIADQRKRLKKLRIRYFPKKERNGIYTWCHKRASSAAKGSPGPKLISEFAEEDLQLLLRERQGGAKKPKGWRARVSQLVSYQ